MFRRNHLLGLSILSFALGLIIGHCLESAFLCIWGGIGLMIFALGTLKQR